MKSQNATCLNLTECETAKRGEQFTISGSDPNPQCPECHKSNLSFVPPYWTRRRAGIAAAAVVTAGLFATILILSWPASVWHVSRFPVSPRPPVIPGNQLVPRFMTSDTLPLEGAKVIFEAGEHTDAVKWDFNSDGNMDDSGSPATYRYGKAGPYLATCFGANGLQWSQRIKVRKPTVTTVNLKGLESALTALLKKNDVATGGYDKIQAMVGGSDPDVIATSPVGTVDTSSLYHYCIKLRYVDGVKGVKIVQAKRNAKQEITTLIVKEN